MYAVSTSRAQAVHSSDEVRFGDRNRNRMLFSLNVVTFGTMEIGVCEESRLDTEEVVLDAEFQRYWEIVAKVPLAELDAALFVPEELVPADAMSITQYFPLSSLLHIAWESGTSEYSTSYILRTASFVSDVSSGVHAE